VLGLTRKADNPHYVQLEERFASAGVL